MDKLNILVLTDFSQMSLEALKMVSLLGTKFEVKLHLLHVIETNDLVLSDDSEFSDEVDLTAFHKEIETSKINFKKLKDTGIDFEEHLTIGSRNDEIRKFGIVLKADLVILGTDDHHNFLEKLNRSKTYELFKHLGIPVISVKTNTIHNQQLSNILLIADYEYFGKGIQMNLVKAISEAFSSNIHLLQILREEDQNKLDEIEAQMKFFATMHQFEKYQLHLFSDSDLAKGIKIDDKEIEIDLICVRTHRKKEVSHFLYGNIAERLINVGSKPILTFHLKEIW
ncbi:MAG: universal stress protein [Sphingobacteriales bacterium]|nr:universal stress protein [Sphingobacteriales bacterium]